MYHGMFVAAHIMIRYYLGGTIIIYNDWLMYGLCLKLQLSTEVEVVFSRGTLSPELQKKVPLSLTREQEHNVDGEICFLHFHMTGVCYK